MAKEKILYEEGRTSWVECVQASISAQGQTDTIEFEARTGYDRLDGIFSNFVQPYAGEDYIFDGQIDDFKINGTSALFDEAVGINDVLAVKANIAHKDRGFPTGGIPVKTGDKIKIVTTDTTPSGSFEAYTRKFYLIFSKPL